MGEAETVTAVPLEASPEAKALAKSMAEATLPELRKLATKHRSSDFAEVLFEVRRVVAGEISRRWPALNAAGMALGAVTGSDRGCRVAYEDIAAFVLGEGPFPGRAT